MRVTVTFLLAAAAVAGSALISVIASARGQGVITLDHAVRNCRLINNKEARLACYDSVIDEADASMAQPAPRAPVASALPAPPPSAALVAAPAATMPLPASTLPQLAPAPAASVAPAQPPMTEKPKDQAAKVASAKWGGNGSIVITLTDGTVWRQVDSTDLRLLPKAGQTLSISNALFGKSICQYGGEEPFDCRQR